MDIEYRLDKRDGQYKLVDFNPRIGANFRMFEDRAGLDVVRALYLDLTGMGIGRWSMIEGRKFIVEPFDLPASIWHWLRGELTMKAWLASISGCRELAWWNWYDPLPSLFMYMRLLLRIVGRLVRLTNWRRSKKQQ